MPDTQPRDAHLNQFVRGLLIGHRPVGMIAEDVLPVVPVNKETDTYPIISKDDWLRRPDTRRSQNEAAKQVNFSVSSDTYQAVNYALGTRVSYELQDNADPPYAPLRDAGTFLIDQLMLDYEIRTQSTVTAGVGSSVALTGGDAFSDFANSDPLEQVRIGREAIRSTTGRIPNTLICPEQTLQVLKNHPDLIRAAFPGAGVGGQVGAAQLASVFDIPRVLVPSTIYNTAREDVAGTYTDVWSTSMTLLHVAPPALFSTTYGSSFRWGGPKIGTGGPGNFNVFTKEDTERSSTGMWTGYYQDEKIIAPELGYRIDTGIT